MKAWMNKVCGTSEILSFILLKERITEQVHNYP